jgi:two-component system invasion response regulator UvrY
MRILVVDDHAVVRRGIKQILEAELNPAVVEEAQDAQETLHLAQKQVWDLVILDINLPGRNGLDLLNDLHYMFPNMPVLVMSMYSEDQYALRVLKAGAVGYLNKQSAPEELIKAIKKIREGGKYISSTVADLLASRLDDRHQDNIQEILSDREYQIFLLIASGHTVSEIAKELSLSVKTVSTYRARLLEKMNLKNNAELTYYAVHNGLLE